MAFYSLLNFFSANIIFQTNIVTPWINITFLWSVFMPRHHERVKPETRPADINIFPFLDHINLSISIHACILINIRVQKTQNIKPMRLFFYIYPLPLTFFPLSLHVFRHNWSFSLTFTHILSYLILRTHFYIEFWWL